MEGPAVSRFCTKRAGRFERFVGPKTRSFDDLLRSGPRVSIQSLRRLLDVGFGGEVARVPRGTPASIW